MKTNVTIKQRAMMFLFLMVIYPLASIGQVERESREVPPFNEVSIGGIIQMFVTESESHELLIETEATQLADVSATVRRGTLQIEYSGRSRRPEPITVYVSAPQFTSFTASGASSVQGKNTLTTPSLSLNGSGASNFTLSVEADKLVTNLSGASNARLTGEATLHELKVSGASNAKAFGLRSEAARVTASGASSAQIFASEKIHVQASGTSHVSYKGTPLQREISVSGLAGTTSVDNGDTIKGDDSADTITVIVGDRQVRIIEKDSGRPRLDFGYKPRRSFRNNWSGFELGVNGYLSADGKVNLPVEDESFDLQYNRSIAVNLNLWQQNLILVNEYFGLVTGIGLGWNNYRFANNDVITKGPQSVVFVEGEHEYKKNKLTVTHLNVPFLLEFQTPGRKRVEQFHLSAGVNVGLRIGSHTKQMVFINNSREKFKDHKDFYLNPFRYDLTARVGWGRVNMFASYSLNSMFRDGRAPELTPFAVGFRLVSF